MLDATSVHQMLDDAVKSPDQWKRIVSELLRESDDGWVKEIREWLRNNPDFAAKNRLPKTLLQPA